MKRLSREAATAKWAARMEESAVVVRPGHDDVTNELVYGDDPQCFTDTGSHSDA